MAAPNHGNGRPKGAQNKTTRAIKEMVTTALDQAGGVEYLVGQANANPAAFMALVGRIIPKEVDSTVTLGATSPEDRAAATAWAKAEVAELFGLATGGAPA